MVQAMKRFLNTAHGRRLLCLLSGAVFSLSYRVEWLFWLVFPCLTAFFLLDRPGEKGTFGRAYCFFAGFLMCLCTWFSSLYPLVAYGFSNAESFLIAAFCCVVVPLLQALIDSALWLLTKRFPADRPLFRTIGVAALWTCTEWLLSVGELAFPWGQIALSQTGFLPLVQTVSVFGVYGLTFAIVFVCALLAEGICGKKKPFLYGSASVLASLLVLGTVLLALPNKQDKQVSVALIQGNFAPEVQWDSDMTRETYNVYLSMTEEAAANGAELIILPESAVNVSFKAGSPLHLALADIAEEYGCTILLGVLQTKEDGVHNGLVAVNPDHSISGVYEKRHLVPFGEFLPMEGFLMQFFPSLAELNKTGSSLVSAESSAVIASDAYTVGGFICFDSVFTGKDRAVPETDFSVVVTNDGWFKKSSGIYQHLRYSKLRAIESGKTLFRSANTGISAVIDPNGRILSETEPMVREILYADASYGNGTTLYSYIGNAFVPLCWGILLALLLLDCKRHKKGVLHETA